MLSVSHCMYFTHVTRSTACGGPRMGAIVTGRDADHGLRGHPNVRDLRALAADGRAGRAVRARGRGLRRRCPLCQDVAAEEGWLKEGSPTSPVVAAERPRRRLGLSLATIFERARPQPTEPVASEPILRRLSPPELAMVEAADLFNASAFRRTRRRGSRRAWGSRRWRASSRCPGPTPRSPSPSPGTCPGTSTGSRSTRRSRCGSRSAASSAPSSIRSTGRGTRASRTAGGSCRTSSASRIGLWPSRPRRSRTTSRASGSTASSGDTFESTSPATGETIGVFPKSGAEDVDRAVQAAKTAFPEWRLVPAPKRGQLLFRGGQVLAERKEELARS